MNAHAPDAARAHMKTALFIGILIAASSCRYKTKPCRAWLCTERRCESAAFSGEFDGLGVAWALDNSLRHNCTCPMRLPLTGAIRWTALRRNGKNSRAFRV